MIDPLSTPLTLRQETLRHRLALPAMSTYQALDGALPDPAWHPVHYAKHAVGMGLVIVEATAVAPEGRATPRDLGLWNDTQTEALAALATAIADQGATPALQLSHAGRKASRTHPWHPAADTALADADGGWQPLGPSASPFADGYRTPDAMTHAQINSAIAQFTDATRRALTAGFRALELHAGHGRLLHSFLSPHANHRTDVYGHTFDGRTRLLRETVRAVREAWPAHLPLLVRISATDHLPEGWTLEDSVRLAPLLTDDGADLLDCTSGGIARPESRPVGPAWQAPYARTIRSRTGVPTAAVGKITTLRQAEELLNDGSCDLVLMGRQLLCDPMLAARTAPALAPAPYQRALASVGHSDGNLPPEL